MAMAALLGASNAQQINLSGTQLINPDIFGNQAPLIPEKYKEMEKGEELKIEADPLAWRNKSLSADERATLLIDAMNQTERMMMLSNYDWVNNETYEDWSGGIAGYPRLKVPTVKYMDGPQGFRDELVHGSSTAFPSCEQISAAWDRDLVE